MGVGEVLFDVGLELLYRGGVGDVGGFCFVSVISKKVVDVIKFVDDDGFGVVGG